MGSRRVVPVSVVFVLVFQGDDVHITAMQLFESKTHALIIINKALVGERRFRIGYRRLI